MTTTPSSQRISWKTLAVAALTLVLVWWFLKQLDLVEVGRAFRRAHVGYLALSVAVTVQTYLIRALRWQFLLVPIGRASYRATFRTTVIGFAATFFLPGRIGEVLRPYLLARHEGLRAPAVFATVIVERVLDLAAVLLLFGLFAATTSVDVGSRVRDVALIAGAAALVLLGTMAVMAGHPERLGRLAGKLTALLPRRLGEVVGHLVQNFTEGLAVMRRPSPLVAAFLCSTALWVSVAFGLWLVTLAFALSLPFMGSFLVLIFLVLGVAVPTPGGAGPFHIAYIYAMTTFFGAATDPAGAAAIMLHAVSFVPVGVAGLVFMAQDGLTLGGLKQMRSRAEAAERSDAPSDEPDPPGARP
jgi:uncharacterized protein (TIRG00374 family)